MSTSGTYIPERAKGIPFTDDEVSEIENTHDTHFNSTAKILTILKTQPTGGDRGIIVGGGHSSNGVTNAIEYITISTTGDAQDFSDLTDNRMTVGATSNGSSHRAVFGGGSSDYAGSLRVNIIEYVTITSPGDSQDFGDLSVVKDNMAATSNGPSDRGIFPGGNYSGFLGTNVIEYITISTTGDAQDFGDLLLEVGGNDACSNGSNDRGVNCGGYYGSLANVMDYVTISTTGNTTDFGDLTSGRQSNANFSNGIDERGIIAGGYISGGINNIDYITISILGNSIDFGDLSSSRYNVSGTSNGIGDRGVIPGGSDQNVIDYITISTLGNAQDFGDLSIAREGVGSASNGLT